MMPLTDRNQTPPPPYVVATAPITTSQPASQNPVLAYLSSLSGRRFLCVMAVTTFLSFVIITSNFGNQLLNNQHFQAWFQSYFTHVMQTMLAMKLTSNNSDVHTDSDFEAK